MIDESLDDHDTWAFKRSRAAAELSRQQSLAPGLRHRAVKLEWEVEAIVVKNADLSGSWSNP